MRPKIKHLLKVTAHSCGVPTKDMSGTGREGPVVEARLLFVALAHHYGYRHYEIGWAINKTRQSADYYVHKAEACKANPYFQRNINNLLAAI